MRKSLWISLTLTWLGFATTVAQAATPNYDALYVFGDSYCDVGNLFAATGDTYPAAPYYMGLKIPIILLTAKTHEAEKILGLDVGADDYVTKPFSPRELRARIRALLRRAVTDPAKSGAASTREEIHQFGPCELDMARFELRRNGESIDTTTTELKLLAAFVRNRGRLLTRERLLDEVWGPGIAVTDRVIDNHIVSLRKKIEDEPSAPRYLISVRGLGYRFDG